MRFIKKAFIAVVFCLTSAANAYDIIGNISGAEEGNEITLSLKTGSVYQYIAKAAIKDKKVHFALGNTSATGVYRLQRGTFKIDLLFDHQDIAFYTTYLTPVKNIAFSKDAQNQAFYRLRNAIENNATRRAFLTRLLNVYSVNDPFYQVIQKELAALKANSVVIIKEQITKDAKLQSSLLVRKIRYEDKLSHGLRALAEQTKKANASDTKVINQNAIALLFGYMDKQDGFLAHGGTLALALDNYLKYHYFLYQDDEDKQNKLVAQAISEVQAYFKGSKLSEPVEEEIKRIVKKNGIELDN